MKNKYFATLFFLVIIFLAQEVAAAEYCSISAQPNGSYSNLQVSVGPYDGTAHQFTVECQHRESQSGGEFHTVTDGTVSQYTTSDSYTFQNVCYDSEIFNASTRNLHTQETAYCRTEYLPPAPRAAISAKPNYVSYGGSSIITWSSYDADYCEMDSRITGHIPVDLRGSLDTGRLTRSVDFTLTCTQNYTQRRANAYVNVTVASEPAPTPTPPSPPPTVTLSADRTRITAGETTYLRWSSTYTTSCSANWTSKTGTADSQTVSPAGDTTYTMTCSGSGGTNSATVTIYVDRVPESCQINSFTADNTNPGYNQGTILRFSFNKSFPWSISLLYGSSLPRPSSGTGSSGQASTDNLTSAHTYRLNCNGAIRDLTVTPQADPNLNNNQNQNNNNNNNNQNNTSQTTTQGPACTTPLYNPTKAQQDINGFVYVDANVFACFDYRRLDDGRVFSGCTPFERGNRGGTYTLEPGRVQGYRTPPEDTKSIDFGCETINWSMNYDRVAPPRPTATLSSSPSSINYNSASTLTWSSTNATTCTASGAWSGSKPTSGSQSTGNLTSSQTYNLSCSGEGGSGSDSETVTVNTTAPAVNLSASPNPVAYNSASTLSWSTTDATSCTASGAWSGSKPTSGSQSTGALTSPQTYYLECTGPGGSRSNGVTVNVQAQSFDYSLSNSGNSSVTKSSGDAYTQNTITKTLSAGSSQSVSLSVSGVPSGVSYTISNNSCSPTCSSTITFTVTPSAPVGTYPITVTGQPLGRSTNFNLIINSSPLSASCTVSPFTALLGQSVTWTAQPLGGVPPYTYRWSGTSIPVFPAPGGNPYVKSYSTIGRKTAQAEITDADGVKSTCPEASVQINFSPIFREF